MVTTDIFNTDFSNMSSTIFILIGPPGSGKTTFKNKILSAHPDLVYISPDEVRGEVNGDENDQSNSSKVFAIVYQRLIQSLSEGKNVIYDATNCRSNYRRKIISVVKDYANSIYGIIFDTPLAVCLARNNDRDRVVPEHVIEQMYLSLRRYPPNTFEGFDYLTSIKDFS